MSIGEGIEPFDAGSPEGVYRAGTAAIVADGDVPSRAALDAAWPGWSDDLAFVVGADGGAPAAERLRLAVDLVVGDLDSLAPEELTRLRSADVAVEVWPAAKDYSDLELALRAALRRGPARLILLGALGGARLDHELANLWLLALPELANVATVCLDGARRVQLLRGPAEVQLVGRRGDLVSLLPFADEASGITTHGLAYPLRGEALPLGSSRGLSNTRDAERARVSLRAGRLLIIETHRSEGEAP